MRIYWVDQVNIVDNRHAGIQLLMSSGGSPQAFASWEGGVMVGESGPAFCNLCKSDGQSSCHPKPHWSPGGFGPSHGMFSACYAGWTPGPDILGWGDIMGYNNLFGRFDVKDVTIGRCQLHDWGTQFQVLVD